MKLETSKDTDLSPKKSFAKRERFWQYSWELLVCVRDFVRRPKID